MADHVRDHVFERLREAVGVGETVGEIVRVGTFVTLEDAEAVTVGIIVTVRQCEILFV